MLFTSQNSLPEIWATLSHELHRGALDPKHPFRYVTLGTFGESFPEIRTVVLRKLDANLNGYVFTDFRSAKVKEIKANSSVSLHFYHPKKRTQVRIQAKAIIHHRDELVAGFWQRVQGDAQKAYTSILPPGETIDSPEKGWEWSEEMGDRFFAVLKFIPESIEALQLDGLNHLRIQFSILNNGWKGQWLVP